MNEPNTPIPENKFRLYQPMAENTPPSPPPYHNPAYYRLPLRRAASKRDMIFACIFLVLSLLCVNFFLYGQAGLALSPVAIGLYVTGVIYLFPGKRHFGFYPLCCMLLYVLCALTLGVSHSGSAKFLALAAMLLLSALTVMDLMDLRRQRPGRIYATFDWLRALLILPFDSQGDLFFALFHKESKGGTEEEAGKTEKRKLGPALLGIGCAIPVLLLVIPLLTNADAAFSTLLRKITFEGGTEPLFTLLLGLGLFLLYFGQHFGAAYKVKEPANAENTGKPIDTTVLGSFLGVIVLIYVLYLLSQLAYFFSAFAGLLPEGFTVAEYARQGFFEMVAVCLINLLLILVTLMKARKNEDGKEPVIIRIFALFLCVFSLVLIATAIAKMFLYIDSFGMTHLRLMTSVFMVFLCVIFVTVFLWVFLRKIPYMKVAVIAAALLIALVGFANPNRVVAQYNVNAYLRGDLETVDMDTLRWLEQDSVVPYLWELRNDKDAVIRENARQMLFDALCDRELAGQEGNIYVLKEGKTDWRAFTFTSHRSYTLLKENRYEIFLNGVPFMENR
ncbi:MAG: DUF4173 domain-containing protein [Oscillospiraceae bacterium]|nr:DUF4173 domain-containing protein [Oscillospiraceae bacterium]